MEDKLDSKEYGTVWDVAQSRIPTEDTLWQFITTHAHNLPLQDAATLCSVGPGGGQVEYNLMTSYMPNLRRFFIVDPCISILEGVKHKVGSIRHVKTEIVHSGFEEFRIPDWKADVIILSHVLYYVYGNLGEQLRKIHQWLSPGGVAIITIVAGEDRHGKANCYSEMIEYDRSTGTKVPLLECNSVTIGKCLDELGFDYTDYQISFPVSIQPGPGLAERVQIQLNRRPSQREFERCVEIMRKYCAVGSDMCQFEQKVFIVKKR